MSKKIAILTSGGDAPGMNNAVRAIVKYSKSKGIEPFVVLEGYKGLHAGNIVSPDQFDFDGAVSKGGTLIYSARFPEFKDPKVREEAKAQLEKKGIDSLVVIGGDGSYHGAQLLHEIGVKTIGLPGTIDNDITSSDFTIGYDTALNTIIDNVQRVRDTADSHNRAMIVEVMGHGSGDLALYSAMGSGAEIVSTNEHTLTVDEIAAVVKEQMGKKGKRSVIAIVSEHIYPDLIKMQKEVEEKSGFVTRAMSFAHIQRGGAPTALERVLATTMGIKAVDLLVEGKSGLALGLLNGKLTGTPILEALALPRANRKDLAIKINKINQA